MNDDAAIAILALHVSFLPFTHTIIDVVAISITIISIDSLMNSMVFSYFSRFAFTRMSKAQNRPKSIATIDWLLKKTRKIDSILHFFLITSRVSSFSNFSGKKYAKQLQQNGRKKFEGYFSFNTIVNLIT